MNKKGPPLIIRFLKIIIPAGILILLISIPMYFLVTAFQQQALDLGQTVQDVLGQKSIKVDSSKDIVTGIAFLGQLVTVEQSLAKAKISVGVRAGIGNSCGYTASHVAQGAINAGINLANMRPSDVKYDESTKTYTINLPAPSLLSCRIDQIEQYYTSNQPICGANWDELRIIAQYEAMNSFRETALGNGILEQAKRQSELVVGTFAQAIVGSDAKVKVNIPQNTTGDLPSSCKPQPPAGWAHDDSSGQWYKP